MLQQRRIHWAVFLLLYDGVENVSLIVPLSIGKSRDKNGTVFKNRLYEFENGSEVPQMLPLTLY